MPADAVTRSLVSEGLVRKCRPVSQELVSKYHPEIVDAQKLTLPAEAQLMS